jgi:hypothetical protein
MGHVQADKFRALAQYEIKDNQNYLAQVYFKYLIITMEMVEQTAQGFCITTMMEKISIVQE